MQINQHFYRELPAIGAIQWTAAILTLSVCLCALSATGAAVTRTWDGGAAGADANWMTAANWSGNVAPVNGDNLSFAGGVAKLVTTNNFANNTDFGIITLSDSYTLRGNTIDLTNTVEAIGGVTGVLELNFRLTRNATFNCTLGSVLQHSGTITLNGFDL